PPRQKPERAEVRHRENIGIAAVPIGQPQAVDDGAVGVPPQRGLTEREPVTLGPVEELRGRDPLTLRVAERIAPRPPALGQRTVLETVEQFPFGCRRVDRLRHDCVALSPTRAPTTTPNANAITKSP